VVPPYIFKFHFFTKSTELFLKPIKNYRTIADAIRIVELGGTRAPKIFFC